MDQVEQRGVGVATIGFEAGAFEGNKAEFAGVFDEGAGKARLADASFARNEHGAAMSGSCARDGVHRGRKWRFAANEKGTDDALLGQHRNGFLVRTAEE